MSGGTDNGRVSVVGSLNVDITFRLSALPVPGETCIARERTLAFGGKGGNQAAAVAGCGGFVDFIGAVGHDEDGARYIEYLRNRGVDVTGVAEVKGVETGTAVILVDEVGENLIVVDAGANSALDPRWVGERLAERRTSVTVAQLEVSIAALEAVVAALDDDDTFILNPAPMVDSPALERILARVDILVPNRKELGQLVGQPEPLALEDVDACVSAAAFDGAFVVTLGAGGAAVYEPGKDRLHFPAPVVQPIDTSGAGDAFCGALATALARSASLDAAVDWAVQVSARSTLNNGAQLPGDFAPPDFLTRSAR